MPEAPLSKLMPLVLVDEQPTRRDFVVRACQAATLLAAGGFSACGGSPSSPSGGGSPLTAVTGAVNGRVVSVTVDAASPLVATGSLATVQTGLGTFLLARINDTSFAALTAVCTHEGCTVSEKSGTQFRCPCHGSQFTASGQVAQGPASRSLQSFPTQFDNGVLTFTV